MGEVAFVALGSNLGDRSAYLASGREGIAALKGTRILAATEVEETEPFGPPNQPRYLNQMVAIETSLTPRELLDGLLGIERTAGRVRRERWGPRTLDLDIVKLGDQVVREPGLDLPHPGLPQREFWQRQLATLVATLTVQR